MTREHPYTADEQRVCYHIQKITNGVIGCGDDPIGLLMASHDTLVEERKRSVERVAALEEDIAGRTAFMKRVKVCEVGHWWGNTDASKAGADCPTCAITALHTGTIPDLRHALEIASDRYEITKRELELRTRDAALRPALQLAKRAIDDWMCTYAPDVILADEASVRAANARLSKYGVLGYIVRVQSAINTALAKAGPPPPNTEEEPASS